ncbi:hypothetical protein M5K25_011212 [Dendrobium thyrsiflorum]|uniref:Uncharacterized protein n=1 Tax=Dendrobium thyrsiflorum TaxID=117978 RepID=A0ABD0V959_DENTH
MKLVRARRFCEKSREEDLQLAREKQRGRSAARERSGPRGFRRCPGRALDIADLTGELGSKRTLGLGILMASRSHLDDDDDFGGDYAGSHSGRISSGEKRAFGDLDEEEDDVFGTKKGKSSIEESGPGAATGMILSLRESLQNCKDELATCQVELQEAQVEIQKWHSAFQNGPALPAGASPEPTLVVTHLQNLKSSEDSLKEQLDKAKKREAAFIVTFAKRDQEIADLKSAVRDLKKQLQPPSMQEMFRWQRFDHLPPGELSEAAIWEAIDRQDPQGSVDVQDRWVISLRLQCGEYHPLESSVVQVGWGTCDVLVPDADVLEPVEQSSLLSHRQLQPPPLEWPRDSTVGQIQSPVSGYVYWARYVLQVHRGTLQQTGIYEAVYASLFDHGRLPTSWARNLAEF